MPLKLVFCGTPAFAVPSLRALLAEPYFQVAGVVTQPDRPRGRGKKTASPPVKDVALEAGVAVYQPEKIKSESSLDYFRRSAVDVVVIIAYGQIIPAALIAIPRLGWINLHGSLLPKYRGAAPINWAIVNGEKVTGLTTMQIDAGKRLGAQAACFTSSDDFQSAVEVAVVHPASDLQFVESFQRGMARNASTEHLPEVFNAMECIATPPLGAHHFDHVSLRDPHPFHGALPAAQLNRSFQFALGILELGGYVGTTRGLQRFANQGE